MLWIGHFDLSNSLGIPGQFEHPLFQDALEQLVNGMRFEAEILDTWKMSVAEVPGDFTLKRVSEYFWADADDRSLELPGQRNLVFRIRRIE